MALVTVEGHGAPPTLDAAAKQLGVAVEDIDAAFGVVPIAPKEGLYSVRVRADRLPAQFDERKPYQGPFSNPPIVPYGPIQDGKNSKT